MFSLTFPVSLESIPKPSPVSLYSSSASTPNFSLLKLCLTSVILNFWLNLCCFRPPLFFLGLSSGMGNAVFYFAGGGSWILANLLIICSFIMVPAEPSGEVLKKSILMHFATFVDSIRTNLVWNLAGVFWTNSSDPNNPLWSPYPLLENPSKARFYDPMTCILQAGIVARF